MSRSIKQKGKGETGSVTPLPSRSKSKPPKSRPKPLKKLNPGLESEQAGFDAVAPDTDSHALIKRPTFDITHGSLERYLAEINRFPLLTRDEENALALHYWKTGDPQAAHKLVTANLRFVVKIAMQYARYGVKLKDLIQEGNIGLMLAVKKYDPNLGNRLISYAVWWIRAYIQKYLLDTWSIVRVGTTQAQRKLFSSLQRIQRKLRNIDGIEPSDLKIAETMNVREKDVREMKMRLEGHDLSLDAPIDEEGSASRVDFVPGELLEVDELLIRRHDQQLMQRAIQSLRKRLNEKELAILNRRLLSEDPITLDEIGKSMSISRERVRQIEENLKKKLREAVKNLETVQKAQ